MLLSASTAKQEQVQSPCPPTGKRIIRWWMLFFCSFVAAYGLALHTRELHEFCRGCLLLSDAFALKGKQNKKPCNSTSFCDCRACFLVLSGWGKTNFHSKGLGLLLGCQTQALCCKCSYLPSLLFKLNPVNSCLVGRWRFRDWKTWGWWPKGIWKCGTVGEGKFSTRGISLNSMALVFISGLL